MTHYSRYIVGIDLGTTNIAVSYMDTEGDSGLRQFAIPQLVAAGEIAPLELLPSFCYLPGPHEVAPEALELPWSKDTPYVVGTFAREQGSAVPGRLVASAKSWLAHAGVDRDRPILPWGGDAGEASVSPVTASRYYLEHVRQAWDAQFGSERDQHGTPCVLAEQQVILTVPASFDEVARELVVKAAREAKLEQLVLLEEPLAAFYAWLWEHESDWRERLSEGETILVVDVGGGTTDFSLIEIEQGFNLRRTAVGEHLLLGGDNIDMAIGRAAETEWKIRLSAREWSVLCQECRRTKEKLLSENGPEEAQVAVSPVGSSVVAGTRSYVLTRKHLMGILMEGFFPEIDRHASPPGRRTGIREMGLPYVADPAVTRHLLAFLRQAAGGHGDDPGSPLIIPNRVLFNGGALLPELLRRHLSQIVGNWAGHGAPIDELEAHDLNLAVSRGSAYYGLVRRGAGVRVKGGIARSYYLEVAAAGRSELICVVPRDTLEGKVLQLANHRFSARANRPVRFPLYSSATRLGDELGQVLRDHEGMTQLPPLQTVLSYGKGSQRELEVEVAVALNEVGTLDIWCTTADGQHKYPLSFDLRAVAEEAVAVPEIVLPAHQVEGARSILREVFAEPKRLSGVARELERVLEVPRRDWGVSVLRALADVLFEVSDMRTRSPQHEARWLNLMGFFVRPGFGAAADQWRMRELWKTWHHGAAAARGPQVVAEWWICWRRVAGGLRSGQQEQIANVLLRDLRPKGQNRLGPKKTGPQVAAEMWRCLGALERLPSETKHRVLKALVETETKLQDYHMWVIARLGARRLFHGPANTVIPAVQLEPLLPMLFSRIETRAGASRSALFAVTSLCRMCGIRDLDVTEGPRQRAAELLSQGDIPEEWNLQLFEMHRDSQEYQAEILGDTLPLGLSLNLERSVEEK